MQVDGLPRECRVLIDGEPRSGEENMALDAALLNAVDRGAVTPVVRIYRWNCPTVSLGYFQDCHDDSVPARLRHCPRVFRLTGGGAILHDREMTYSCVIPKTHPVAVNPAQLYVLVHLAIRQCLAECGASVGLRGDVPQPDRARSLAVPSDKAIELDPATERETASEPGSPFLCFLRSDPRDLVAESLVVSKRVKIVGSAQRRRRGAVLQHGSILMRCSDLTPHIMGICDLFPAFDEPSFEAALPDHLGRVLGQFTIRDDFSETESDFAFEYRGPMLQNTDRPDDIARN